MHRATVCLSFDFDAISLWIGPFGVTSPSAISRGEFGVIGVELLLEQGFRYDSSLMGKDFEPYWCRVGDVIDPDGPYRFGEEVALLELPVSWILDDFPHFEYLRLDNRVYPGLSAPSKVEEIWRGEFDFMYRDVPGGVFTLTMHPQVIGRGHRMLMLERLIEYFLGHEDVRFVRMDEVANEFRNSSLTP